MQKRFLLVTVVLFAVAAVYAQDKKAKELPPPKIVSKKIPPPPPPTVDMEKFSAPTPEYKEFLEKNSTVKKIGWGENNTVRIYLKDGKEEKYDLNNKEQAEKLENKYGELPPAPPPPPKTRPKKPAPPKKSEETIKFTPPQIKKDQELPPVPKK